MTVFGFVKLQVNKSFEPEFGNPSFETPEKLNVFNFQSTCFSAFVGFINGFCTCLSRETWSLKLISFLRSAAKEGFRTQLFKTRVLTQPDFENPKKKSISNMKKVISGLL